MSGWLKRIIPAAFGAFLGYNFNDVLGVSKLTGALLGGGAGALLSGSLSAPQQAAAPAPVAAPPEQPKLEAPKPEAKQEVKAAPAPAQQTSYTLPPIPQVVQPQPVIQQATQEPVINNPAVQAVRDDTRRRILASEGQQSTILTGEDGEEDPIVRKRKARGRRNILEG